MSQWVISSQKNEIFFGLKSSEFTTYQTKFGPPQTASQDVFKFRGFPYIYWFTVFVKLYVTVWKVSIHKYSGTGEISYTRSSREKNISCSWLNGRFCLQRFEASPRCSYGFNPFKHVMMSHHSAVYLRRYATGQTSLFRTTVDKTRLRATSNPNKLKRFGVRLPLRHTETVYWLMFISVAMSCNRENWINNSSLSLCLQGCSHQCTGQAASIKSLIQ